MTPKIKRLRLLLVGLGVLVGMITIHTMTLPCQSQLIVSVTPCGGLCQWIESSLVTVSWIWSLQSVVESLIQEPAWSWAIMKILMTSKEPNVTSSTQTLLPTASILYQERCTWTTARMRIWVKCHPWKFSLTTMFMSPDQISISSNKRWKVSTFARAPWLEKKSQNGFLAALSWTTTIKSMTWRETRSDLFQASTPNRFICSPRTSMNTLPVNSSFTLCSTAWSWISS